MRARRSRGFWPGLLTGVGLAALIGAGLAWVFPPAIFLPPQIEAGRQVAPAAPPAPGAAADPGRPRSTAGLPVAAAPPPVADLPGGESVPDVAGLMPPSAPEVYDGARGVPLLGAPSGARLLPLTPPSPGAISGAIAGAPVLSDPARETGPGMTAAPAIRPAAGAQAAGLPDAPAPGIRAADPGEAEAAVPIPPAPTAMGRPTGEISPGIGGFAPLAAPTIFDGGGAGAPSLARPE